METKPTFVKGKDGKTYMELHNPEDELKRALHPETGTERDYQWQDIEPVKPPPPLLDLPTVWRSVRAGEPISVAPDDIKVDANQSVYEQNALILIRELKFYLLATNHFSTDKDKAKKEEDKEDSNSNNQSSQKRETAQDSSDNNDEKSIKTSIKESTYGASVLLKLQWEDRTTQKNVTRMDYAQLGKFMNEHIVKELESTQRENNTAARAILDALALDVTPILFSRLLDGIESDTSSLESASFNLLMLCANYANPKEMHMGVLTFYRKIDSIYMQATSYYVYDPLVRVWTATILRIERKRNAFLKDFIKVYDKLSYSSQGWVTMNDDVDNVSKIDRCSNVPQLAFQFYVKLAKVQREHYLSSKAVREKVDRLGRALPSFGMLKHVVNNVDEQEQEQETGKKKKKKGRRSDDNDDDDDDENDFSEQDPTTAEARDWVAERAVTLARGLQMQQLVWNKLALPSGEGDLRCERTSKKKSRKKSNTEERRAEEELCEVLSLIRDLGWTNPVLACQVASKGLVLDLLRWEHESIGNHIGTDVRTRKQLKNSVYSVASIGQFLCGCFRPRTRKLMEKRRMTKSDENVSLDTVDEYSIELEGSGFDLLEPKYAFELALPYLLAVLGQSCIPAAICALGLVRAFLEQLGDTQGGGYEDVTEEICGMRSMGYDVSIFGLAQHVSRTVGMMNDVIHRRFAYETLQMVLRKCVNHPGARYSVVEGLFVKDVERVAVQAQLVTEMKDAIRYSDECAWGEKRKESMKWAWSKAQASELKSRFVQLVMAKYLLPRKEMLGCASAIVTTANAMVYVAGSDARHLKNVEEDAKGNEEEVRRSIEARMKWMKMMVKLGKECVRALATAADHDRKTVPKSKLVKEQLADAKELYSVSGKTLNQCVTAVSALDLTQDLLKI